MDKVRTGVIGCGYWGPNLLRNLMELPDNQVVAVADLSQERLDHINKNYPQVTTTKNYHDLFSTDLDAVVIATPPSTHYDITKECFEHQLHVLVEKPLTLKTDQAEQLVALADEKNLLLMVGHTFEYNEAVRAAKKIIDSGELGRLYYINTVRANLGPVRPGLNALWDLAPHDVSILLYLLEQQPLQVSAQGAAYLTEGHQDIAFMHLVFPDNVVAHVHVSWLDPCKVRRITIVGSKKMLVYDDMEPIEKLRLYDKGVDALPYTDTFGGFQYSYRYGEVTIPNVRLVEPLKAECEHFIECVRSGQKPLSDGRKGLAVVKILSAAENSLHDSGTPQLFV